jgi:hypothetical protein
VDIDYLWVVKFILHVKNDLKEENLSMEDIIIEDD